MGDEREQVEPMDIDSLQTKFTASSRREFFPSRSLQHVFQQFNNLSESVEPKKTFDVSVPDIRRPSKPYAQRELVANAPSLDETYYSPSATLTENGDNTVECYSANIRESEMVNNGTPGEFCSSFFVYDADPQDQIVDQLLKSHNGIPTLIHDSAQNMESSTLESEDSKIQPKHNRLNISLYVPADKATSSVGGTYPTQRERSVVLESQEPTKTISTASTSKKNHYRKSGIGDSTRRFNSSIRGANKSVWEDPTRRPSRTISAASILKENQYQKKMPSTLETSRRNHHQKPHRGVNARTSRRVVSERNLDLSGSGYQLTGDRISRYNKNIDPEANTDSPKEWFHHNGENLYFYDRSIPSGSQDFKLQDGGCPRKIDSTVIVGGYSDGENDQTTLECDSFSDIEDLICGLKEFKAHKWTPPSSAHRLFVGNSGSWYDGDFDGKTMSGFGTLFSSDKRQFVQGKWLDNRLTDLHSCQFTDQGAEECTVYLRKQANCYLLTFDEDEFVARAELSSWHDTDFTSSFRTIKLAFFRNLTITKVIEDGLQSNRQSSLVEFEKALGYVINDASHPVYFAFVLIMLRKFLKENSSQVILTDIVENVDIPDILRNAAGHLLVSENMLSNRRLELLKFSRDTRPPKLNVESVVHSFYIDATTRHRRALTDKCPSCLPDLIANISDVTAEKIIFVSKADVEVFHHLASLTKDHGILVFFNDLQRGLFEKLDKISSSSSPNDVMPLSTPVYGFLFKSFLEIATEISLKADCTIGMMITQDNGKWKLIDKIRWDHEQSKRVLLMQESLECQFRFIFKLLCYFEPKQYRSDKNFNYDIKIINKEEPDGFWLLKQFKKWKNRVTGEHNFTDMPEDRKVWLYILDHTVDSVLVKNNPDSKSCLELFRPMLDGHVTFLSTCPTNSYESFRVVTHNILLFMVQTYPHLQDTEKLTDKDVKILEKQMKYISNVANDMKSGTLASSDFRNLIDEYNRYWSLRHLVTLDDSICPSHLVSQIKEIHDTLLQLVDISLQKAVNVSTLVNYLRELNDFMEDFKDIDFLSIWYVKSNSNHAGIIEKIDNKICSETKCSYKVIDLKGFVRIYPDGCVPRHHIAHIVQTLLMCAIDSLSKSWVSSGELSVAQLEGTGALLGAIRRSFLYLKEQPDYRDFELFSNESVEPFLRVVNNCNALGEFKIRVNVVKESFWYIRKMDEIGIVQALELFNSINNGTLNTEILKQCYDRYLTEYNEYISNAESKNLLEQVNCIVESMKNDYEDFEKFSEWDNDFKNEDIPKILAGLSAVWSLLISKDVSSSGKFLKPHCIQILCIMRLLSVDNSSSGVEHHLAQVLTGQGKSVILGLLSAFLAFTGYDVRTVCYSKYLADRDEEDFNDFFEAFELNQNISYGTFSQMARELFNPEFDGRNISLRRLIESLVLEHKPLKALGSPNSDLSSTVLLIDEVDVFFSENIYGRSYRNGVRLAIPGLSQIQEKIWNTVRGSAHEKQVFYNIIQEFIDEGIKSGNEELEEYNKFILKPGNFSLLEYDIDGTLTTIEYTNRSLLEQHLLKMIEWAMIESNERLRGNCNNNYRIVDGEIKYRDCIDGVFKRYVGYEVIFSYFRLKEVEFDHKNHKNYGYLGLNLGDISYAKLPEEFPLILGVTGTLSTLSNHENEAIQSYNINKSSILPSFFGESNLKFKQVDDFCIMDSTNDWGSKIFERTIAAIEEQRSVLVFFDTEAKLKNFQQDYGNRFDRLNVLTENTSAHLKLKYVDEAGITSTVTLATRMMGRGVDFKSSMAVEKKGGVHVIQTFFSIDVKEETQIKGRTARKDNKGSYELILCKPHLTNDKLLKKSDPRGTPDYSSLHKTRLELMNIKGAKNADKVKKSEKYHNVTMDFFGISAKRQ